jgi:hypothetical protein
MAQSPDKIPPPNLEGLPTPNLEERPGLIVHVSRIHHDPYFTLQFVKDGRLTSEELEAQDTMKWFMDRGVRDDETLGKSLDDAWNFYETVIEIPGHLYREPPIRFPAFQPNI